MIRASAKEFRAGSIYSPLAKGVDVKRPNKLPANNITITIEIEPGTGVTSLRDCDSAEFCLDAYSLICELVPLYTGENHARVSVQIENRVQTVKGVERET